MLQKSTLPTIVAAAMGISLFCSLGVWQLHRAEQKRALHGQFLEAAKLPPVSLDALPSDTSPLWRQVQLSGTFLDSTILLDNRVRGGQQGYEVFTAFQPEHGPAVLVNRGWLPAGASRAAWPVVDTPTGHRMIEGRLAPVPSTGIRLGGATQFEVLAAHRWRAQHLDDEGLRAALALPLRTYTVLLAQEAPDGFARQWQLPEADDGKHTAYAVQWFAFAAIALGLAARAVRRQMKTGESDR